MSRLFSATAFAAAVLAFALPFGAVSSCDGEEVRFTGVQLATFTVQPDDSKQGDLHVQVERNGGALALVALVAAAWGLALAAIGRAGGGVCASIGLLAIQLLFWAVLLTSDGGDLFVGFWLALASLAGAATLHLVLAVRARRRSGSPVWTYVVVRTVLALLPTLALFVLVFAAVLSA